MARQRATSSRCKVSSQRTAREASSGRSSAFEAAVLSGVQCAADDTMAEQPSPTRGSDLQIVAEYDLQNGGKLAIALGDIVTYEGGL